MTGDYFANPRRRDTSEISEDKPRIFIGSFRHGWKAVPFPNRFAR
jgi:hypothetical protein